MIQADIWVAWGGWTLLPPQPSEYPFLVLLLVVALVFAVRRRRDFVLTWGRLGSLLFLVLATAVAGRAFVATFPRAQQLPIPSTRVRPGPLSVSLVGAFPLAAAAAWLGPGPALLVGLSTGLARALLGPLSILEPFAFALCGHLAGGFLQQRYRGWLPAVVRQPVVGLVLSVLLSLPLVWVGAAAHAAAWGLDGLDYAWSVLTANALPILLQGLVAGLFVQILYILLPGVRPLPPTEVYPPYRRSLLWRLLLPVTLGWLLLLSASVVVTVATTIGGARQRAVNALAANAENAAGALSTFIRSGQGLLALYANETPVQTSEDPYEIERRFAADLRNMPFFSRLALYERVGQPLAIYPRPSVGTRDLTAQEDALIERVLEAAAPQAPTAWRSPQSEVYLAFAAPVERPAGTGALVGWVAPQANPLMAQAPLLTQGPGDGGDAFVIDGERRIVLHYDAEMLLREWQPDEDSLPLATQKEGSAYIGVDPLRPGREIVFVRAMDDLPWTVVVRLPYRVVLAEAVRVAVPVALAELGLGAATLLVMAIVARRLARPLGEFATAADRIAEGDLTQTVRVSGWDEVGRLGASLERMRARLRQQQEDTGLMLQVSQALSSGLDLFEVLDSLAEAALRSTRADIARALLVDESGMVQRVAARGEAVAGLEVLDEELTRVADAHRQPFMPEGRQHLGVATVGPDVEEQISTVLAVPVRAEGRTVAVIWLGYKLAQSADRVDSALLSVLAAQAAGLLENARRFTAVDSERRRLIAVLKGAPEPLVACDSEGRVVLINPAGEQLLRLGGRWAIGDQIAALDLEEALVDALAAPVGNNGLTTQEVTLADGRTLVVRAAALHGQDGARLGQVASIEDVTQQKRQSQEQVRVMETVLHDLRAPLTFVRGYAAMLPMVGEINEKQQGYLEKIQHGVELMTNLMASLLELSRIEAGEGLGHAPCHLGAILVEAVDCFRAQATAQGLTLRLEPAEQMAVVTGDPVLLRQAVANLLDNAIKFTPAGGVISVGMRVERDSALVCVADTGIGIAPEDHERVFGKFGRVRRRDTMHIAGTGLGLATVRSIVERHAGKVWVESELGRGSRFFISLPLAPQGQGRITTSELGGGS